MNKGRVEAFSDGVFAIAITLLVFTIAQPSDYSKLARQLLDRWPSLAAYVVSFLVLGIMWLNHHTVFSYVQRIDHGFFYRNLALLMTVVFIPYPTEVFGEALSTGAGERTAAVFYSIVMTVNALAWSALWLHASTGRRLLNNELPRRSAGTRPSCSWPEPGSTWSPSGSPSSIPTCVWPSTAPWRCTTPAIPSPDASSTTAPVDPRQGF